jgi:hypothetical protein
MSYAGIRRKLEQTLSQVESAEKRFVEKLNANGVEYNEEHTHAYPLFKSAKESLAELIGLLREYYPQEK